MNQTMFTDKAKAVISAVGSCFTALVALHILPTVITPELVNVVGSAGLAIASALFTARHVATQPTA